MIPQEKVAAVSRGLAEAFQTTTIDEITRMTRGLSSDLVFRIVVTGSPYLLRIMTRIDEQKDPARIFACSEAAAAAGLAPRVWYADRESGIAIFDFIPPVPMPLETARDLLPGTLRRLHALPPFPKTFNWVTAHNGFIWRFRRAGLLPQSEIDEVFARYDELCAVYPRLDSDMVSCHMDLKPENILFDGQRVWLIDWEAGFINDRYFDLAMVANFVADSETDERAFLADYAGAPPTAYQQARFFLMRQASHLFYAAVFVMLGSAGKPPDLRDNVPAFDDFHRRLWAGEVDLTGSAQRLVYGRVHWERLRENVRGPRFHQALAVVAQAGHTGPVLFPAAP